MKRMSVHKICKNFQGIGVISTKSWDHCFLILLTYFKTCASETLTSIYTITRSDDSPSKTAVTSVYNV